MTEDEARKKWCPMVRQASSWVQAGPNGTVFPTAVGINRELTTAASPSNCIASDCMMWRIAHVQNWAGSTEEASGFDVGYCGLAGQP